MGKPSKKSVKSTLKFDQRSVSDWVRRSKEDIELKGWLKKAKQYEVGNDYARALDAYLNFLELKLEVMKSRPEYTINDYLKLVPYYIKIGDCYKNIPHYKKEDRVVDFSKAAEYYRKAADMYLELEEYPSANVYFEFTSKTYEEVGLYIESAEAFKAIADMYLKLGNNLIASSSYAQVGGLYEKAGAYDNAYDAYARAAQLSLAIGDVKSASLNYRLSAELLRKKGKFGDAIEVYTKAAEIDTESERYADVAKTYLGIAQSYEEKGDLKNAVSYYVKTAETSLDSDDLLASKAFENSGRLYLELKKYSDSINYFKKASTINVKLGNHTASARCQLNIGKCYTLLGDYEKAADSYVGYARYASIGSRDKDYLRGYQKAAELYSKIADLNVGEEKFSEAVDFYKKAAKNYENLQKHNLEAEFYLKAAFIERKEDVGNFFETFTKAAERYKAEGEFNKSAECYLEINEYLQAAREFTAYAVEQLDKGNIFNAAEGYRMAGSCYAELSQKDALVDRYNKAVQTYLKYIGNLKRLGVTEDEVSNIGEAYMGIGESSRALNNLSNAEKYFEDALQYFEEKDNNEKVVLSRAFLSMTSAKLAIQRGDYPIASDLLSISLEKFEEAIARGGMDERYLKFLEGHSQEVKQLLVEVGEKPEISLSIDHSAFSFVETTLRINMSVTNLGSQPLRKITFLPHLPESISVTKPPEAVEELTAKQSIKIFIEVYPKKKGKHRIKAVEVLYEDVRGNKYVKSSNIVSIEIVEKPQADYRKYMDAARVYQKYADNQLQNKNYIYAGEGYKSAAECFKEFALKRSGDLEKMGDYYKKAIESYVQHIEEADVREESAEYLRQMGDTVFNIADCHENIGDLPNSEKYLKESIDYYEKAAVETTSEKEKALIKSQLNIVTSFLKRVDARVAIEDKDYLRAKELLETSVNMVEEAIGSGWNKEYEDFLKKNQVATKDLLGSIKNKKPSKGGK